MKRRPSDPAALPVKTLWRVTWQDAALACVIYRCDTGMQMRLESSSGTIMSEPFDMAPKAIARTRALRAALVRRGWQIAR